MEKDPKWHLIDSKILVANCLSLPCKEKENLTRDQESLKAFFHTPLQVIIEMKDFSMRKHCENSETLCHGIRNRITLSFSKCSYAHREGDRDNIHTVELKVELNGPLAIKTIV